MKKMNIAVASYSFHGLLEQGKCDVFNYLNMLKYRYNVNFADIWSGFLPTLDEIFIGKVKSALDSNGMKLANLCVDGPHLWVNDPEQREAHKKQMYEYIKAANQLGAKTIRIDFGGTDGYTMPEEAFEYIVKTYREYCAVCYDLGMKIGPENHWGWDRVPEYLEKVRDAVDSPAYGHLYHFRNFYDNVERGEEIAISYAMHTHIHAASMPYAKEVICKLANSDYKGAYSVEQQLGTVRGLIAELKNDGFETPVRLSYFDEIYGLK